MTFADIKVGQLFYMKNPNRPSRRYLMCKTELTSIKELECHADYYINAVNVLYGGIDYIEDETEVSEFRLLTNC